MYGCDKSDFDPSVMVMVLFTIYSRAMLLQRLYRSVTRFPVSSVTSRCLSSASPPTSVWSLGKLNHVAIAVPNLEAATSLYRDMLGATVSAPQVKKIFFTM